MKNKKIRKTDQFTPKQIEANKLKQLQIACEKMISKGSFHMFSPLCKARMTGNPLPAVKLKLTQDANIPHSEFKIYNDVFVSEVNRITIATLTRETMTLAQYLREAMTLICYSEVIHKLGLPNAAKVIAAYEGYQRRITQPILELMALLYRLSTLMSDLSVSVLEYEVNPVLPDDVAKLKVDTYFLTLDSLRKQLNGADSMKVEQYVSEEFNKVNKWQESMGER